MYVSNQNMIKIFTETLIVISNVVNTYSGTIKDKFFAYPVL